MNRAYFFSSLPVETEPFVVKHLIRLLRNGILTF